MHACQWWRPGAAVAVVAAIAVQVSIALDQHWIRKRREQDFRKSSTAAMACFLCKWYDSGIDMRTCCHVRTGKAAMILCTLPQRPQGLQVQPMLAHMHVGLLVHVPGGRQFSLYSDHHHTYTPV